MSPINKNWTWHPCFSTTMILGQAWRFTSRLVDPKSFSCPSHMLFNDNATKQAAMAARNDLPARWWRWRLRASRPRGKQRRRRPSFCGRVGDGGGGSIFEAEVAGASLLLWLCARWRRHRHLLTFFLLILALWHSFLLMPPFIIVVEWFSTT
jgi:hypothetical protein